MPRQQFHWDWIALSTSWIVLGSAVNFSPVLASDRMPGEIALSAPGNCSHFLVFSGRDFSLLHARDFYTLYEGDPIRGPLQEIGDHDVEIVGEARIGVTVEEIFPDLQNAAAAYRRRCHPAGR